MRGDLVIARHTADWKGALMRVRRIQDKVSYNAFIALLMASQKKANTVSFV